MCFKFSEKQIDIRTALFAMNDWITCDMAGKIIQSSDIIKWIVTTPYLRFRNERLFLSAIAEHNKSIWAALNRERMQDWGRSQIELNRRAVGSGYALSDAFGPDTFGLEDFND